MQYYFFRAAQRPVSIFTQTRAETIKWRRAAPLGARHPDTVTAFPAGTRTAADAAVGCMAARIAKSIVFRAGVRAVVVITAGANRVDAKQVATALGMPVRSADAGFVRETTGFAIGGVAPVGHLTPPLLLFDCDLLALHPIWAASGSPSHAFPTEAETLLRITGAPIAGMKQDA